MSSTRENIDGWSYQDECLKWNPELMTGSSFSLFQVQKEWERTICPRSDIFSLIIHFERVKNNKWNFPANFSLFSFSERGKLKKKETTDPLSRDEKKVRSSWPMSSREGNNERGQRRPCCKPTRPRISLRKWDLTFPNGQGHPRGALAVMNENSATS